MLNYIRVIGNYGSYFAREFEGKKKGGNQYRVVDAETITKPFFEGEATVTVKFDGDRKDEVILLDSESDPDLIKKYLGEKFIEYKRD